MRILFLTPRVPYPPTRGDQLRAYHQLRLLAQRHEVVLACFEDGPAGGGPPSPLRALCRRVEIVPLPRWRSLLNMLGAAGTSSPFQVAYYRSPLMGDRLRRLVREECPDLVFVQLIRMAPYASLLGERPCVLDMVDALSLNMRRRAEAESFLLRPLFWSEWKRTLRSERKALACFDEVILASGFDRTALDAPMVRVIPNGVDIGYFAYAGQGRRQSGRVVFTGNMGYFPNREAVRFFLDEIWPEIRREVPEASFQIVGDRPARKVRASSQERNGVQVTGWVDDLRPYLWEAQVAVSPLRTGSGMPNKILEAMAAGAPVVATPSALCSIEAVPDRHLLVASTPREFANHVIHLLRHPEVGVELAAAARDLVEQRYSWESSVSALEAVLADLVPGRLAHGPREVPDQGQAMISRC